LKWLLFKLAFFYPRVYAFLSYYWKSEKRMEFQDKVIFLYSKQNDPHRIKEIVKGVFELRGVRKVMRYLIPLMDDHYIKWFVKVEGLHYLDGALKEEKGVLLMAGHIGIPHLAFNALRVMGYEVILLSGVTPKTPKHPKIRYYDTPDKTIFTHDLSLSEVYKKRILETLRSGKIIYYDGDAGEGRKKENILFLGREMDFPTGMVHLAHQSKAAIVPFIHLYEKGKITLIFREPLENHWKEGRGEYKRIISEFANLLESYILSHPEQYLGIYGPTVLNYYYWSHRNGGRPAAESERSRRSAF
jgi:lauroyl/myristoyl acyltransferase